MSEERAGVIERLCARAGAMGLLRPGVTTDDLLLLLVSLGHAVQITDECRPQMWNRLLRISLDGLRADHREPLPPADTAPDTHHPNPEQEPR